MIEDTGSPDSTPKPRSSLVDLADARDRILAIWCDVVGADDILPDDNFFDVGGTSIGMSQLRKRIEAELGHAFSLTDLFRLPTVNSMAQALVTAPHTPDDSAGQDHGESQRTALDARRAHLRLLDRDRR